MHASLATDLDPSSPTTAIHPGLQILRLPGPHHPLQNPPQPWNYPFPISTSISYWILISSSPFAAAISATSDDILTTSDDNDTFCASHAPEPTRRRRRTSAPAPAAATFPSLQHQCESELWPGVGNCPISVYCMNFHADAAWGYMPALWCEEAEGLEAKVTSAFAGCAPIR